MNLRFVRDFYVTEIVYCNSLSVGSRPSNPSDVAGRAQPHPRAWRPTLTLGGVSKVCPGDR
jgi:hypothetical protein